MIAIPVLLVALAATPSSPPDSEVLESQNRKIIVFRAPVGASGPQGRASAAARWTERVLPKPAPWVLQQVLNDWTFEHQTNVSIDRAPAVKIPQIYRILHGNIQDAFNEAGVEIMSPSYFALRDGNPAAIPVDHRPT